MLKRVGFRHTFPFAIPLLTLGLFVIAAGQEEAFWTNCLLRDLGEPEVVTTKAERGKEQDESAWGRSVGIFAL